MLRRLRRQLISGRTEQPRRDEANPEEQVGIDVAGECAGAEQLARPSMLGEIGCRGRGPRWPARSGTGGPGRHRDPPAAPSLLVVSRVAPEGHITMGPQDSPEFSAPFGGEPTEHTPVALQQQSDLSVGHTYCSFRPSAASTAFRASMTVEAAANNNDCGTKNEQGNGRCGGDSSSRGLSRAALLSGAGRAA